MLSLFRLLIGAILLGTCLFTAVRLLRQHRLTRKLRAQGLRALGEVVNLRRSYVLNTVVVEYVFQLQDGSRFQDEFSQKKRVLRSHPSVGDVLEVLYLPEDPRQNQCEETEVGLLTLVPMVTVMVFLMVVTVYLMMMPDPMRVQARGPRHPTVPQSWRQLDAPPRLPAQQKQQRQEAAREDVAP
ncbi:DUF3592 domain-containing protein [Corallococcus silvisoli]|uniref:DUF3592 domain-containing protein n=1 Tax=Corallococcus silvisoli TaxID=2697031 RepID=UPI00137808A1|nr:DUF3592 domain-containing protein [Corallococcus silvisoli]NBD09766.1 DUF3592 domain-containing protein [Corallococcus silvisoli]